MAEGLQEELSWAETQRLAITLSCGSLRDNDLRKPLQDPDIPGAAPTTTMAHCGGS